MGEIVVRQDGEALYVMRLLFGSAMLGSIVLAVDAVMMEAGW